MYSVSISKKKKEKKTGKDGFASTVVLMYALHQGRQRITVCKGSLKQHPFTRFFFFNGNMGLEMIFSLSLQYDFRMINKCSSRKNKDNFLI